MKCRLRILVFGVAVVLVGISRGQTPATPEPVTMERATEVTDMQDKKVQELVNAFLAQDAAVEKKVQQLVDQLASLRDSLESKTRIAKLKSDAIDGLNAALQQYVRERKAVASKLRMGSSSYSNEQLQKVEQHLDEKLKTRVDQMMELANSMHRHQGYSSYGSQYRVSRNGRLTRSTSSKNPRATYDRKQTQRSEKTQEDLSRMFEKERDALRRRNQHLKASLNSITKEQQEIAKAEIERNDKAMELLDRSSVSTINPTHTPTTEVGGSRAAQNAERLIRDRVQELEWEMQELRRMGKALEPDLARLNKMQKRLVEKEAEELPATGE